MNRHHLSLWILLAVGFVAMACISIFGPVNIFGYELKDSGLAGIFQKDNESDDIAGRSLTSNLAETGENKNPFPAPLDTASKRILFIGDSMLDGLYPRLAAYADKNGHELYVVIWYSSTSEIWGRSERLSEYIKRLEPDFIFLSIGANELFVKDIADKRDKYVKKIIADIGSIPYIWIGPPNWAEDTGINRLIASNTAPGCFFLSKDMKFDRKKDGAHPTMEASAYWLDSIASWMPRHAAHPIRMELPEKTAAKAKRVFVHNPNEK